jgi:hypothetical protein
MLMMRFKQGTVLAALLLSSSFAAQADTTTYAFTSVTGIVYSGAGLSVTGVLAGTPASTTVTIAAATTALCGDLLLRAIAGPETYSFTIVKNVESADPVLGGSITSISSCGLSRNP